MTPKNAWRKSPMGSGESTMENASFVFLEPRLFLFAGLITEN